MSYMKEITKLVYRYGDQKDKHLIALHDVWLYNSVGDINIYIEDAKVKVKTYTYFIYELADLKDVERYSILESLEKYAESVKEMLNKQLDLELSY